MIVDMATMDEAELAEFRRTLGERQISAGGGSKRSKRDAGALGSETKR
jgi:hypothetical protein